MDEKQEMIRKSCDRIMELVPENLDDYARRNLNSELSKHQASKTSQIARVEFAVDKCRSDSILHSLADIESPVEVGMGFTGMSLEPIWEYDTPTRRLKVERSGKGGILYFQKKRITSGVSWDPMGEITTEKAMVFLYTTKWFYPETVKTATERPQDIPAPKPSGLISFFDWWDDIRTRGFVPFEIVVCAYTKTKRFMYTMDLVKNLVLMDYRQGAFSRKRVERTPIDFLYLDKVLASNDLKDIQKKVLMYAFEVEAVAASEIAFGFHITETMARNHLMGLVDKGVLKKRGEGSTATFFVNLELLHETRGEILSKKR